MTEADAIINVGVSGPGVVKTALGVRGESFEVLCETIKKTNAFVTTCRTVGRTGGIQASGYSVLVLSTCP